MITTKTTGSKHATKKKFGGASRRVTVHAGGITKKDKYSDIYRARQQQTAAAAHLANKENR